MSATAGQDDFTVHPQGANLTAVTAWLAAHRPGLITGDLRGRLITGGKSNLTYLVRDDAGAEFVLRRPPLGHVLATAHDMGREATVMSALADAAVPVPVIHAHCADDAIIGAPFYLMSKAEGTAHQSHEGLVALGAQRTRTIMDRAIEVLASLHEIDPESVGLGSFGRPEGYLARQVSRWRTQFEGSKSRELPDADRLHDALAASVPPQGRSGIVHGDYRLDNVLVDDDERITAVLDWEMSTLGDPLSDLAILLVYSELGRDPRLGGAVATAPQAPGYPGDADIIASYAATSTRDLTHLPWYVALANYKLASIMEGIYFRFQQGKTVGIALGNAGEGVNELLAAGLSAWSRDPGSVHHR